MVSSNLGSVLHRLALGVVLLLIAGCGGGDGGNSGGAVIAAAPSAPAAPPAPVVLTNFATIVVDAGPAALNIGPKRYTADDSPFVSVTLCVPGTTTCQTIDHVLLDTGSVGLRIAQSALSAELQAGLPQQIDPGGNPVGECYGFVDGYTFGSVRQADFQIGGEKVANMPLQVIGDVGRFAGVPSQCSSGGGSNMVTVQDLGANGILGVGTTTTDCGTNCAITGGTAAAGYYDCPPTGCGAVVARAAVAAAPFEQLPNPVAAMAVDNNGTMISLPAVPYPGAPSVTGTIIFGIATQTNNGLGTATVLATSSSRSASGPGLLTVAYRGQNLTDSFIDSGSNGYYFVDASIPQCTEAYLTGFYCPPSPLTLSLLIQGRNGLSIARALLLYSARDVFRVDNAAVPGVGGNPEAVAKFMPYPHSFDLGLPFYFGRSIYTAIEGRNAGGSVGPYVAVGEP